MIFIAPAQTLTSILQRVKCYPRSEFILLFCLVACLLIHLEGTYIANQKENRGQTQAMFS